MITVDMAMLVLDLQHGTPLSIEVVNKAFREKCMSAHPDHGGTQDEMELLQQARERLLKTCKKCPTCGGSGSKTVKRGFITKTVRCDACKGSGKAN